MTAQPISGTALSQQIRAEVSKRAAALTARGVQPGLAVILVGEDPASAVYVRNKVKACQEHGLHSVLEKYDATLSETDLLARIQALNNDPAIHGILVQMPLPKHINPQRVIETISTAKDVDGYSVQSAGDLMAGLPGFRPCTPYGCMKLIESTGEPAEGQARGGHRPQQHRGQAHWPCCCCRPMPRSPSATAPRPTWACSPARPMWWLQRWAVATRSRPTWSRPGAIVIDVGMNRNHEGKLCGDVDLCRRQPGGRLDHPGCQVALVR